MEAAGVQCCSQKLELVISSNYGDDETIPRVMMGDDPQVKRLARCRWCVVPSLSFSRVLLFVMLVSTVLTHSRFMSFITSSTTTTNSHDRNHNNTHNQVVMPESRRRKAPTPSPDGERGPYLGLVKHVMYSEGFAP